MRAPAGLAEFYAAQLGLDVAGENVWIGATRLELQPDAGRPFYHCALLVPGDRFAAALAWAGARVELLPDPETGSTTFEFEVWDALACYFHDPAGNIVELIAHRGVAETGAAGPFSPAELLGLSELGLVGDTTAMAEALARDAGLAVWSGSVEPGSLAFVGERARTLILAPPGRGWLPTGRPAGRHAVDVDVAGAAGEAVLEDGLHVVRGV